MEGSRAEHAVVGTYVEHVGDGLESSVGVVGEPGGLGDCKPTAEEVFDQETKQKKQNWTNSERDRRFEMEEQWR